MTYTLISEHDNENKKTDVFLLETVDPKTGENKAIPIEHLIL